MGIDFGKIFGDAQDAISDAWGHVTETGVPAVLAGIEQYGANQLSQMAQSHSQQAAAATQKVLQGPPPDPNSLLGSISNSFGQVFQTASVKQYAPWILVGGGVIALLILRKR